jgi:copper chaperone
MTCAHCERAVTEAIREKDPAAEVAIDLTSGLIRVSTTLARQAVAAAVAAEGYNVLD